MAGHIHSTAIVDPLAKIANNVEIGPFSIVHANVELAGGSKIGAYCELGVETSLGDGSPLIIEKNALIRSHAVFYESSHFGEKLVTGHRVVVRENTKAGKEFQIGSFSDIQGDCVIGDHVRFQTNIAIGKQAHIGDFVWVFPYVVLLNDPHPPSNILIGPRIEDFAVLASMSLIFPGVTVGRGALIAAHSALKSDAEPDMVYMGSPARKICSTRKIRLKDGSKRPAYPWTTHFNRGYPEDIVKGWNSKRNE